VGGDSRHAEILAFLSVIAGLDPAIHTAVPRGNASWITRNSGLPELRTYNCPIPATADLGVTPLRGGPVMMEKSISNPPLKNARSRS
jgi:hypothetical protein